MYDWSAIAAHLGARAIAGVELVTTEAYSRTIGVGEDVGTVRIAPARDHLVARVRFPRLSALPSIIARIRRVFDLAADPAPITAHLARDPALGPLVRERPGLRVPGAWDGFELAIRAVLGQQITVAAARRLASRLAETWGAPLPSPEPGLARLFPTPAALAEAEIEQLGMPGSRAETLRAVARAALADPALFSSHASLEAAISRLKAIKGVGEWTAQYIALRQLRLPDAFPAADLGLLRAMEGELGRRPSAAELLARAEAWRPWRAYAAQHLWTAAA